MKSKGLGIACVLAGLAMLIAGVYAIDTVAPNYITAAFMSIGFTTLLYGTLRLLGVNWKLHR